MAKPSGICAALGARKNTRSELQRAKRKRLIWGWVDSTNLRAGDLDHLVVTRHGGLIAVDSKWRNRASDTIDMAGGGQQGTTARRGPGADPPREANWSSPPRQSQPATRDPGRSAVGRRSTWCPRWRPGERHRVRGRPRLVEWLRTRDGQPVSEAAATDVVKQLKAFRARPGPARRLHRGSGTRPHTLWKRHTGRLEGLRTDRILPRSGRTTLVGPPATDDRTADCPFVAGVQRKQHDLTPEHWTPCVWAMDRARYA